MKGLKRVLGVFVWLMVSILLLPEIVFASNEFDQLLTDGKLVVKSVKPNSVQDAWAVVYENTIEPLGDKYYLDWSTSFNEDFTRCTIYYGDYNEGDPSIEVEISYAYDEDVKEVVDSLVSQIEDKDTFNLNEIEFINYLINESEDSSMANYSSELKKAINYKNFSIDVRMGDDAPFLTEKGGNAIFSYNGTTYYIKGMTSALAKHIIYIDDDATDVLTAIKERLTKHFGTDFDAVEKDTIANFLASERQSFIDSYATNTWVHSTYPTDEEYADAMMEELYNSEEAPYHFVVEDNVYEKYYTLTINEEEINFIVIKDSSKVNDNVALITNDVASDVTISADTALIPLDTLIQVKKITSGEDYEKIINILKVTNSEMFDLKLFSSSIGDYITRLENGSFEVKIPISEDFKGKELIVYYVNDENEIVEYQVTIDEENEYAIFTTDHFSIYTLAEKTNSSSTTEDEKTTATSVNNPKTGDHIMFYISMLCLSLIGLAGSLRIIYTKK